MKQLKNHTDNKHQTLFNRYKRMINLMWADGQRRYTSKELNRFVGDYEKSTWWKRATNNQYYTTRTYQTQLKQLGCITMIKRGVWQINGPIPEWFSTFHFEFLGTHKYNQRSLQCLYWQSLSEEQRVNPWKSTPQAHIEDALIELPKKQTTTTSPTIWGDKLPQWVMDVLYDVCQNVYDESTLTYKDVYTFTKMATKQDINKLLEICWDWTSELTNPDDIDTQELVELVHEVIGKQTKSEDDLAHELYGVDNDVEVRITPQRDKELRQKYPANVEGTLEFRIAALEDAVTKQLNLVNKLLNIIEKTNK